jgi:hypothetical protein
VLLAACWKHTSDDGLAVADGSTVGVLAIVVAEGVVIGVSVPVTGMVMVGVIVAVPDAAPIACSKLAWNASPAPVRVWVLSLIMASWALLVSTYWLAANT